MSGSAADFIKLYKNPEPFDAAGMLDVAAKGTALAKDAENRQSLADIGLAYQQGGIGAARDTAFGRGKIDTGIALGEHSTRLDQESRAKIKSSMEQLAHIGKSAETLDDNQWSQTVNMWRQQGMAVPAAYDGPQGRQLAAAQSRDTMEKLRQELVRAQTSGAYANAAATRDQNTRAGQLHDSRMSQYETKTPDERRIEAPRLGLEPGTVPYYSFVDSGKYMPPESANKFITVPEGSSVLRTNTQTGRVEPAYTGTPKNKAEDKFREAAASKQADRYDDAIRQGNTQNANLSDINTLRQLSNVIGQPGVANSLTRTFGPALRAMGLAPERLSDIEAFTALTSRLIPQQRPPGSGTMSDKDVEMFRSSLPALSATAQGRKFIMDQMEAIAQYDIARARIASQVINGELSRQDGERALMSMPDPMVLFRQTHGETAAPVKINSPMEAMRLPPGTRFVTPDGQIRIKR